MKLFMKQAVRRILIVAAFAAAGAYGLTELRGPKGLPALKEQWNQIRQLEEENANLQRENEYRRDRIKKLESNASEQELEIRKKLKLLRHGETTFILPEQPKLPSQDASPDVKPELDSAPKQDSK